MKITGKDILVAIVLLIIIYTSIAFVMYDADPNAWGSAVRFLGLSLWAIFVGAYCAMWRILK